MEDNSIYLTYHLDLSAGTDLPKPSQNDDGISEDSLDREPKTSEPCTVCWDLDQNFARNVSSRPLGIGLGPYHATSSTKLQQSAVGSCGYCKILYHSIKAFTGTLSDDSLAAALLDIEQDYRVSIRLPSAGSFLNGQRKCVGLGLYTSAAKKNISFDFDIDIYNPEGNYNC